MRTRCPVCSTVFRVTSEQLRLKAGKVRCGHCQAVFNAFDELMEDTPASEAVLPPQAAEPAVTPPPAPIPAAPAVKIVEAVAEPIPSAQIHQTFVEPLDETAPSKAPTALEWDGIFAVKSAPNPEPEPLPDAEPAPKEAPAEPESPAAVLPLQADETTEQSTQAAREAGLMAVRELNDAATYNRWSEGTLASSGLGGFAGDEPPRATWPFVLVAILLVLGLFGQMAHHYRTELVQRLPATAALFEALAIEVPLPRLADLVTIEASNLQSDNGRGLFILQATLHNRASFAQEWPALELTLTDTTDTVVSRRVLQAADYLPPGSADAFPANGEIAVKLWVEAKNIGAAGYRLYIFYP